MFLSSLVEENNKDIIKAGEFGKSKSSLDSWSETVNELFRTFSNEPLEGEARL